MARKRALHVKRVRRVRRVRKAGPNVTRVEFDALVKLLNERGEIINAIRRELNTQFTRIAQLQQEIDDLKRKSTRSAA